MSVPTVPLAEISTINPPAPLDVDDEIAFVPMASVSEDGSMTVTEHRATASLSNGFSYFQNGDVLVAKITPCYENNKIALAKFDRRHGFGSTEFHVIRANLKRLDSKYLLHFLRQDRVRRMGEQRMTGSAGQRRVPKQFLAELAIPLPPLDEQQRVAAILDQADDLRRQRIQSIRRLEDVSKALYRDLITRYWEGEIPFPEAAHFQEGPGIRNWQFRDEGIKLVNVKNIVDGKLDITNSVRYLSPKEVQDRYSHFLLDAGDFVMASSGVTWGKIAKVSASDLPLCLNTSMIRVRSASSEFDNEFIRAFIEYGSFRQQIDRLITGSAQPNFGPSHLRKVLVPKISQASQRDFSVRMSHVNKLKSLFEKSVERFDGLFSALQSHCFRAEKIGDSTLSEAAE